MSDEISSREDYDAWVSILGDVMMQCERVYQMVLKLKARVRDIELLLTKKDIV